MNYSEYEDIVNDILSNDDLGSCQQEVALNEATAYYKANRSD